MSAILDGLLYGWDQNLDYGLRLFKDIPADRMTYQPGPEFPHPAWVLCHINLYHPVLARLVRQQPFDDPKDHPFGYQSTAVDDLSQYPGKDQLIAAFTRGHHDVAAALREAGDAIFEAETPLPRWKPRLPRIGLVLPDLMLVHESTHLGQVSAWRRVQGLPRV